MTKIRPVHSATQGRSFLPGRGVGTLADLLLHPIFLMTRATHYDPNPDLRLEIMGTHDNQMTASSSYDDFSPDAAKLQHTRLRVAKFDLGGSIILDEGHPDQFDGVYSADPTINLMKLKIDNGQITGVHIDTIASNFYNHSRNGEVVRQIDSVQFFRCYLTEIFGITVTSSVHIPKVHGEGTGDNVYDPFRDMFFSGFKPKSDTFAPTEGRSDPDFHRTVIKTQMNVPAFGFEVHNGFFHSDTVVGPTPKGDIVVYPGGLSAEDFERVKSMTAAEQKKMILVSHEDALRYAPNLVGMNDNDIITAKTSNTFRQDLEEAGYRNTQTDLSQFVKQSGGGAHCLSNKIILRRDELKRAMELLDYSF